jgi:hypothetical protein
MEARAIVCHATAQPLGRRRWKHPSVPGWRIYRGSPGDASKYAGDLPSLSGDAYADANSRNANANPNAGNTDANSRNADAHTNTGNADAHSDGYRDSDTNTWRMSDGDHPVEQSDNNERKLGLV